MLGSTVKGSMSLDTAILEKQIEDEWACLDKISSEIKRLEGILRKSRFKTFRMPPEVGSSDLIVWCAEKKRLCYVGKNGFKPLIEYSADIRIYAYSFLGEFIGGLSEC